MFVLDTDHLSVRQRRTLPDFLALDERMSTYPPGAFFCTIVSFHEQFLGWHAYLNKRSRTDQIVAGYDLVQELLASFAEAQVLPFDSAAGSVFDSLRSGGVRLATMDLRIAAIVLASDMTLLSRNTGDFGRVPGLRVEDWTL